MTLRDARQYADAVQEAGGRVMIQEHGYSEEPMHISHTSSIASLKEEIEAALKAVQ